MAQRKCFSSEGRYSTDLDGRPETSGDFGYLQIRRSQNSLPPVFLRNWPSIGCQLKKSPHSPWNLPFANSTVLAANIAAAEIVVSGAQTRFLNRIPVELLCLKSRRQSKRLSRKL